MRQEANARKRTAARLATWAGSGACGWAFLFAALSVFWAAGGRTGLHPLEQEATSSGPLWIAINVSAGVLKALVGMLAVVLVRSWGQKTYRQFLLIAAGVLGAGMCLYGGLGLISDVLHVLGVIDDPATRKWFFWYLVLWDPWWVLGGILFLATAFFVHQEGKVGADQGKEGRGATQQDQIVRAGRNTQEKPARGDR